MVYKRYASLFFIAVVDNSDNELITLEVRLAFLLAWGGHARACVRGDEIIAPRDGQTDG